MDLVILSLRRLRRPSLQGSLMGMDGTGGTATDIGTRKDNGVVKTREYRGRHGNLLSTELTKVFLITHLLVLALQVTVAHARALEWQQVQVQAPFR